MKQWLIVLLLWTLAQASVHGQCIEVVKMSQLEHLMSETSDKIQVYNFWASWCGPCVEELPYFSTINMQNQVQVRLVSVDFVEDIDKASEILQQKASGPEAYLLDDKDYIEKVDASWTGSLPATLILDREGNRYFYEKSFTLEELQYKINSITTN